MKKITDALYQWNRIGIPFNQSISVDDILVYYNGAYYSWDAATAMDNPIMLNTVYGWDAENQLEVTTSVLEPGQGYWIYAYHDCEIFAKIADTTNLILPAIALVGIVGLGIYLAKR